MVLKTSGSSRGCPLYWKISLENVVPPATGSCRKFRPDVWRLVVKVAKQWVVKICSKDFFNDWQYFNNGQRDKIVKFSSSNRRRDLSKRKTKPTFYSGLSASRHSLSHKLEYARAGDLFFRLFLHDTFRATSWNTIVRLELVTFYGFLRDILFEPQTGILRYSTARTSFELVPFSAFSLWYFSSCKLKYCSSTVWLELATYFGFFLKKFLCESFRETGCKHTFLVLYGSIWRPFSAFSLWYFSSHKLEYYSPARTGDLFRLSPCDTFRATSGNTTVRLELAIFFGFFKPQAEIL